MTCKNPTKTVITVTVLSDGPAEFNSLEDLAYNITKGDWSGDYLSVEVKEISKREMALELIAQGSDPEFLLEDDGWKYALQTGDEINIKQVNKTLEILEIEYLQNDVIRYFLNKTQCGSLLKNNFCLDITCPFSDHLQECHLGWTGHPEKEPWGHYNANALELNEIRKT